MSRGCDGLAVTPSCRVDGPRARPHHAEMAAIILEHAEQLARIEARDVGKPLAQARADMRVTARYFEYYPTAA